MVRGAPQNFGVPFNIFETAVASDFKFGMQFRFSKAHLQIIRGFPFWLIPIFKNKFSYISAIDQASAFKISKTLGFTKAHYKISRRRKMGLTLGLVSSPKFWSPSLIFLQRLKLGTSNLVCSLGLPRPLIKLHTEEKWAWLWASGAPKNFGVLL